MESNEYTGNPIFQLWAVYCTDLSKSDLISISKASGNKLKNATAFLQPFLDAGIVAESESYFNTFYIVPQAWLQIVRTMSTADYQRMKKCATVSIFRHKDSNFSLSEAVNALCNNEPFDHLLPLLKSPSSYSMTDIFPNKLLLSLRNEAVLIPLLKNLNDYWLGELAEHYGVDLHRFCLTEQNIQAIYEIIIDNPLVPTQIKNFMRENIGVYHEFMGKGNLKEGKRLAQSNSQLLLCYEAVEQLQQGDYDRAFKLFVSSLRGTKRKLFNINIFNFYYAISMAYCTQSSARTKMAALLKSEDLEYSFLPAITIILKVAMGEKKSIRFSSIYSECSMPISRALTLLALEHYQLGAKQGREMWLDEILGLPSVLLKMELSDVLPELKDQKEELCRLTGMHPTLPPYHERPEWDMKLDELLGIYSKTGPSAAKAAQTRHTRIIYKVMTSNNSICPVLQKSKDGINWTAGRNISLENFSKGKTEGMQPEDRVVAACVECYTYGWYGGLHYELEGGKAIAALAGHPLVFDALTNRHLDVVTEKPQLMVSLNGDAYHVRTDIDTNELDAGYSIVHQKGQMIKVVKVDSNLKRTIEGLQQIVIPKEAKDKLTRLLEALSGTMIVLSDLLKGNENIASMKTHPETIVQLQPAGENVRCSLLARPFGKVPPVCKPGKGMKVITTTIEGKQVQTSRNLKKEKENYEAVKELMVDYEEDNYQDNTWMLLPEECLELLDKLREMDSQCVIEWPEGERFKVSYAPLQPSSFHLSINSAASWFELNGEVSINEKTKMKIADLMGQLDQAKGNFILVGDDEYVRISSELRRHIETIERMASRSRNSMRVSTFNAQQLEGLAECGMDVKADQAFTTLVGRIREAQETDIKVPKHIQADLRSYQKEGYVWMSRLAMWGAGALLADDMGLGKTVQTITLLLSRAKEGPQLVIVPTSLILNWKEETARFAPNLNVLLLNRAGDDRKRMIEEAKAFDIVVATYGLLITEEEILCSRTWHTIVLDEAHTIKNRDTKMSKVAMLLKADFRLLLTGTPLQNHVSELWNLMQFANPHLLGSFQEFTDRFLMPIERDHNKERQRLLKRVVTPFILRRTKNDVLNELPEKTEITLKVDLSEEEWAFYDNLRQRALASMEDQSASAMQALAEITRLRQAACNVRLVEKGLPIASSKLSSFMELTDNLHANHHRALVFSQFTSHLALVKEELDKQGIRYLYLDGATPAKERIRLVEEFQHGDMPLFLISLKAGGLGLNLTAADYVIHLDPWWNPAIEEQASDRAYRIGQQKPVTVYRIIAANTIEEKIIALHQTKKNMADALLEGGDVSASMSREEMIDLLKEL